MNRKQRLVLLFGIATFIYAGFDFFGNAWFPHLVDPDVIGPPRNMKQYTDHFGIKHLEQCPDVPRMVPSHVMIQDTTDLTVICVMITGITVGLYFICMEANQRTQGPDVPKSDRH